jgi:hypothetical protein
VGAFVWRLAERGPHKRGCTAGVVSRHGRSMGGRVSTPTRAALSPPSAASATVARTAACDGKKTTVFYEPTAPEGYGSGTVQTSERVDSRVTAGCSKRNQRSHALAFTSACAAASTALGCCEGRILGDEIIGDESHAGVVSTGLCTAMREYIIRVWFSGSNRGFWTGQQTCACVYPGSPRHYRPIQPLSHT